MARIELFHSATAMDLVVAIDAFADTTVTIAAVNNGETICTKALAPEFEAQHLDTQLEWVTPEENVLRQRVTQDIATHGGQFDVMTIGTYEVPA